MFNEKALKILNRQRQFKQTKGMDELDRQAEAEGNAKRFFKSNDLTALPGRRLAKQNKELDGARKTADKNAANRTAKDTKNYIIGEE